MVDDEDTEGFELSRRKVLGGLGAVGLTSAGAGLGTSAYFNDTESFTGNSLTAGTLNLKLEGYTAATNSTAISVEGGTSDSHATVDGGTSATALFTLSDVKPGDLSIVCLGITIEGNPAYLKVSGSTISDDNSVNEAEAPEDGNDSPNDVQSTGTGELATNTYVQAFGPVTEDVDESSVNTIQSALSDDSLAASTLDGGDGSFASGQEVSMDAAFSSGGGSYVLTEGTEDARCFDPETYRLYLALSVPSTVGNVIQSDSLDLDLTVSAVQCRHNDDTPFTDD